MVAAPNGLAVDGSLGEVSVRDYRCRTYGRVFNLRAAGTAVGFACTGMTMHGV